MDKEIKIVPPEGYEIDRQNSTFECIKFKPIKRWRDDTDAIITGYFINNLGDITPSASNAQRFSPQWFNSPQNYNIFATEKQAKSALAMARISQIMANDKRFGGVVTDKEWAMNNRAKNVIYRYGNSICKDVFWTIYTFLAFHTLKQRNLFLEENEDLIKDYLMID